MARPLALRRGRAARQARALRPPLLPPGGQGGAPTKRRSAPRICCVCAPHRHRPQAQHTSVVPASAQEPGQARRQHDVTQLGRARLQVRQDADAVQAGHLGLPLCDPGPGLLRPELPHNGAHPWRRRRLGPPRFLEVRPTRILSPKGVCSRGLLVQSAQLHGLLLCFMVRRAAPVHMVAAPCAAPAPDPG